MANKPMKKAPTAKKPEPAKIKKAGQAKPARKTEAGEKKASTSGRQYSSPQTLRGMRDILPSEQEYWMHVREKAESLATAYGYDRIATPILEHTSLFVRSVGKHSDIVEKELFTLADKGGDSVSLRPEGTAPVARAYVNHGMLNMPQPVKLFYWGPMFRYERPQAGRYRQHHQFGFEVFGDDNAVHDAEAISIAHLFYKELGVRTIVHINSLGHDECRAVYLEELAGYLKPKRSQLCEDCKRRLSRNPLRFFDCKNNLCETLRDSAPQIVDYLDDDCQNHLMQVLEYLDDLQVPYVLDPYLVRGIDYYTKTVFELMPSAELDEDEDGGSGSDEAGNEKKEDKEGDEQDTEPENIPKHALGGGGRYNDLVEMLGGRPTPACGFAIGIERAILQMKALHIEPEKSYQPEVFLAQLGDAARRKAFMLFEEMRRSGLKVTANFSKGSLKSQLEIANNIGAKYTAIIGQQEVLDGTTLLRDMESGMQEIVDYNKVISALMKKLGKA